ncbi:hypothetical protein H7K33_23585 [Mycobacterium paraense]|uniref:hypothetical protein n=1 Tax=Mycobacterium paraense TaxID=767916 RepID=UPI00114F6F7B|nr:hypothetical protein [Mycobacterium paraense]MCV7445225.1 hypothetical protein [Mycobacterium paraense]
MTLRRLDIPASEWRRPDTTAVRDVLTDAGADPARARDWRGSVVLCFAEVPETHPYLNPAVAAFVKDLYSEIPHLLYFLNPDRTSGALDSFYASIDALCETDHGVWIMWSDEAAEAFFEALAAAAEFAVGQGDDWVAVVKGYEYNEIQSRHAEIRAMLVTRGVIPA